ncbi:MAG TPA: 50S ribosomal protein L25 [Anaerolineales bacterium]|nr:50S ribosomal protein L25 [Anaerolineales bacterium]HLB47591.1 50S ribosomal protein L25 [Anaerolineales bacterium]
MNTITLAAEHRTAVRRGLGPLRRSGYLPAVLYGVSKTPMSIQLNSREASRIINRISGTVLVDLTLDGATHKTLLREVQRNFVTDEILHVDFYEVAMDRLMHVDIPVRLVGASPAVVTLGGVLVRGLADIEIECLPGDLIQEVSVDLGVLKQINESIHVSDLQVPSTIRILTHGDEQIARVTYASQEEVAAEKPEVAAEVEVVEKGKKEEEGEEEEEKK